MSANLQKLVVMLEMQNAMNTKVHEQWFSQGFEWYRAIWVECAEMLDHYGWKWWKKQELDLAQLQMELIDIWHFILSEILLRHGDGSDAGARVRARAHGSFVPVR